MDSAPYLPPNQVDSTSTRLLAGVAGNDAEAWRQFVHVYGAVVRYWIRQAGLNKADLADVFQEVFIAVSRNIAEFQRQAGQAKLRAWLKTVTQSKIADHYRRTGKQPAAVGGTTALQIIHELPEEADAVEPAAEQTSPVRDGDAGLAGSEDEFVARRMLEMVRSEFSETSWQAFYRTAVDGRTAQEAAAELNMQPAAVRKAKSRVLARLREVLGG